ncbi:porphobilinogen deaminase-like isoform X2 [Nilaparvata lugens]|uniref:porphobilinogen deaminase-like isoform X2 n=1 Tax=Nilaparvata lugens TaxID=108931 RepID=UPI000B9989FF|nr:porphobilinogen deaminase-like isoform X2 [Nilaparvata lugens]
MNETEKTIRVGSRKSQLALIQTNHVIKKLEDLYSTKKFEIVTMMTIGDQILDKPLPKIGEKSLFTKELETALELGTVDFLVHSLKDMPTDLPEGMVIGAVLEREDPRDVVIMNSKMKGKTLKTLPKGSVVGTSSLRRTAQLQRNYPELEVKNIRGNLNTRLRKLDEDNQYDAIVLAKAGVDRMGWTEKISQVLDTDDMMYAVGQGALAVECRGHDSATLVMLDAISDKSTVARIVAERSFLNRLGGGCSAPVAVCSHITTAPAQQVPATAHAQTAPPTTLALSGAVWSLDGRQTVKHSSSCALQSDSNVDDDDDEPPRKCQHKEQRLYCGLSTRSLSPEDLVAAEKVGCDLALILIKQGALEIMNKAKKTIHSSIE